MDLPIHIAEAQIFRDIGKEGNVFAQYYTVPATLKPNALHIYFSSLPIFRNAEDANRIYYLIYIILLPLSVFLIIRILKGYTGAVALSYLFIINHSVHWGFTGFTMSVPVLLIYVFLLYQYFMLKKYYYIFFIAVILPVLFLLHFQTAIFAILISVICFFFFFRETNFKWKIFFVLSVLPVLILMVTAYTGSLKQPEDALLPYLADYYSQRYFNGFIDRIGTLWVIDNFFFLNGIWGYITACLFTVPLSILFLHSLFSRKYEFFKDRNNLIITIFLSLSFLCYLFLPDDIPGQNVIFQRFSVFIFLGLIILFSKITRLSTGIVIFITISTIIHIFIVSEYMVDFKLDSSDFNNRIFPSEINRTLSGYIPDNSFRGRPVYAHFSKYYTVRKSGIVNGLTDFRFSFIKRNESSNTLPHFVEWPDEKYNPGKELKGTEYILTRGVVSTPEGFIEETKSGKWILYKNLNPH